MEKGRKELTAAGQTLETVISVRDIDFLRDCLSPLVFLLSIITS